MNRQNKEAEVKAFLTLLLAVMAGMLMGQLLGKKNVKKVTWPCKRFVCGDDVFDCDDCFDDDYDCD